MFDGHYARKIIQDQAQNQIRLSSQTQPVSASLTPHVCSIPPD